MSGGGGEEGARRTEGRKEGRADAGGMAANKTRTPHRDVGKNRGLYGFVTVYRCQRPAAMLLVVLHTPSLGDTHSLTERQPWPAKAHRTTLPRHGC